MAEEDQSTESDEMFTPGEVAQAEALISGLYGNFVLVRAVYRGEPICMIATVIEDGSEAGDPTKPKFLQPHAVLMSSAFAEEVKVQGLTATEVDYDTTPEDWRRELADIPKTPGLNVYSLTPPPSAEDLWIQVNTMADHAAATMGGMGIHSTHDGRWCIHLGPPGPERREEEGCTEDTFLDALGHAMVHHVPIPGDPLDEADQGEPLLAEDDPRIEVP